MRRHLLGAVASFIGFGAVGWGVQAATGLSLEARLPDALGWWGGSAATLIVIAALVSLFATAPFIAQEEAIPTVVIVCGIVLAAAGGATIGLTAHALPQGGWLSVPVVTAGLTLLGAGVTLFALRRSLSDLDVQARVATAGVRTRGRVVSTRTRTVTVWTEDRPGPSGPVTWVTVAFVDAQGRDRLEKGVIGGRVAVGETLVVRYSPRDLGRTRTAIAFSRA